jgi:hypothetical protein
MKEKEKKKHWYKKIIYYCPICGSEDSYRERRFDEKPKDYNDRVVVKEAWDYCDAF